MFFSSRPNPEIKCLSVLPHEIYLCLTLILPFLNLSFGVRGLNVRILSNSSVTQRFVFLRLIVAIILNVFWKARFVSGISGRYKYVSHLLRFCMICVTWTQLFWQNISITYPLCFRMHNQNTSYNFTSNVSDKNSTFISPEDGDSHSSETSVLTFKSKRRQPCMQMTNMNVDWDEMCFIKYFEHKMHSTVNVCPESV